MSDETEYPACEGKGLLWIWACNVCGGTGETHLHLPYGCGPCSFVYFIIKHIQKNMKLLKQTIRVWNKLCSDSRPTSPRLDNLAVRIPKAEFNHQLMMLRNNVSVRNICRKSRKLSPQIRYILEKTSLFWRRISRFCRLSEFIAKVVEIFIDNKERTTNLFDLVLINQGYLPLIFTIRSHSPIIGHPTTKDSSSPGDKRFPLDVFLCRWIVQTRSKTRKKADGQSSPNNKK